MFSFFHKKHLFISLFSFPEFLDIIILQCHPAWSQAFFVLFREMAGHFKTYVAFVLKQNYWNCRVYSEFEAGIFTIGFPSKVCTKKLYMATRFVNIFTNEVEIQSLDVNFLHWSLDVVCVSFGESSPLTCILVHLMS